MEEKKEKKIRILVTPSDNTGCGMYRSIWPHQYLQEHYGDEFDVDIVFLKDYPKDNLVNFLQDYDIIVYHKQLDNNCKILDLINFLNIPTIIDLDDNFILGPDHPLNMSSVREGWASRVINHLKKSTCVTTTTPIYADIIKKYNKNVYVLPNAIDPDSKQFVQEKKPSDRIRFGFVCGSAHLKDIQLVEGLASLPQETLDKLQYCLCGFNREGKVTLWNRQTGQSETKAIQPHESVWARYEEIVTDNYKIVSPEHKEWLLKFEEGDDPFENEAYRRFYTKNINEYAKHYENVDVLLAPLKENDFNKTKSQLKAEECAFTNTAIIATNFGPYTIDLVPYLERGGNVNPNGNALLVDSLKNHKQWTKYIKYVVEHPECIDVMTNNLKKELCDKYSIEKVTKQRVELYKNIYQAIESYRKMYREKNKAE